MFSNYSTLATFDPDLAKAIANERQRQEDHLELIASENYTSLHVLAAQGSILTNKYAEGYPGARYYGGCEWVDVVEKLAIERACELYQAAYANVQPHSGSQANAAAYLAMLEAGDTLMGMDLNAGGHLTHGSKVNFSGKLYHAVTYGVDNQSGLIDYDAMEALAKKHQPKLIIAGFSAYSRVVDWSRFRTIADEIGAYFLVDMAHVSGLIAAGIYPSPVAIADVTTSTTHKTLRGPRSGFILAKENPALQKKLNSAIFPGSQGGPLMHVIAAKAVAFKEAMQPAFKIYQQQVVANAQTMATVLLARGFQVVSGGTDNHLLLLDLSDKKLTGKAAEQALDRANITVNKNTVPGEKQSPFVTSGIRLGTAAVTSRGFKQKEIEQISHWLADLLDALGDASVEKKIRHEVRALCRAFPVYPKDVGCNH